MRSVLLGAAALLCLLCAGIIPHQRGESASRLPVACAPPVVASGGTVVPSPSPLVPSPLVVVGPCLPPAVEFVTPAHPITPAPVIPTYSGGFSRAFMGAEGIGAPVMVPTSFTIPTAPVYAAASGAGLGIGGGGEAAALVAARSGPSISSAISGGSSSYSSPVVEQSFVADLALSLANRIDVKNVNQNTNFNTNKNSNYNRNEVKVPKHGGHGHTPKLPYSKPPHSNPSYPKMPHQHPHKHPPKGPPPYKGPSYGGGPRNAARVGNSNPFVNRVAGRAPTAPSAHQPVAYRPSTPRVASRPAASYVTPRVSPRMTAHRAPPAAYAGTKKR